MPFILTAFALTVVLLSLNLLGLWVYSGLVRSKTGLAVNPEDVRAGVTANPAEPEAVQRVLRAHANAQATIYPFLFLGLTYAMLGGTGWIAATLFAVFVVARFLHSYAYINALQPWRSIGFGVGGLATLLLMIAVLIEFV